MLIPNQAWTKIAVDPFHFYEHYYLLIIDYYSKFIVSATFTGVETLEWPWFCHRREHFLFIIVSKVGQTYQQNGRKLRVEVFLSATIFCKHFDLHTLCSAWV